MRVFIRNMPPKRGPKSKKGLTEDTDVQPVKTEPLKKSKKPVKVVAVVTSQGIEGSFQSEPRRPLIAHLQIHSNEVKFHDGPMQYDPNPPTQPEPYDATADNFFSSTAEVVEVGKEEIFEANEEKVEKVEVVVSSEPLPMFTKADLMIQYRDSISSQKIPERTEIGCFWCTHSFENQPCIIPEREEKGLYRVYGNFCCPECAASYLLQESIDPHVRWERMALLHRIYDPQGMKRIFPAPARESLKLFGGPLSIEQFRSTIREGKVRVDIHLPPMVSILGSIDTKPIDFFDTSIKNTLLHSLHAVDVPASVDKSNVKSNEELRLKRSKPLKDKSSTLDAVMNIQIKGVRR